jgi:hypothetical protein
MTHRNIENGKNVNRLHLQSLETDDGVDVTLIRWMLSLTPAKRLRVLQPNAASLLRLRGARTRA